MPDSIPTYVFDEHNEAFYYWHRARSEGFLTRPLDIFHVDAHSDMGEVQTLERSIYCNQEQTGDVLAHYRALALDELEIGNFMIPAVLNSLIRNIYFIYPDWRQFKPRRRRKNVTTAFGEGRVFKHGVKVPAGDAARMALAYPDLKEYTYFETDIDRVPVRREVILDIDLDYFACNDSISNAMQYRIEITEDQFRNQDAFREQNPDLRYSGLEIAFEKTGKSCQAIISFKQEPEESYLPTAERIEREIGWLVKCLRRKRIMPAVITICRSCISGYCPTDYFQMIEDRLLAALRDAYPAMNIADA